MGAQALRCGGFAALPCRHGQGRCPAAGHGQQWYPAVECGLVGTWGPPHRPHTAGGTGLGKAMGDPGCVRGMAPARPRGWRLKGALGSLCDGERSL